MTEQQSQVYTMFRDLRELVYRTPGSWHAFDTDKMISWLNAKEAELLAKAKENKCKCADHKIMGHSFWMEPPFKIFKRGNGIGHAVQAEFKFCPECGREFTPNEKPNQ